MFLSYASILGKYILMKLKFSSSLYIIGILIATVIFILASCSTTKFVPEGEFLLNSAEVTSDTKDVRSSDAKNYIRQKPNYKTFTIYRFPLFVYNLSGIDSTKWVNRTLRNAGEPPVIFDTLKMNKTVTDLTRMMTNKGYLNAEVIPETKFRKKKVDINYNIKSGTPYKVNNYNYVIPDSVVNIPDTLYLTGLRKSKTRVFLGDIDSLVYRNRLVTKGSRFDLDVLDKERERITTLMKHTGYYAFNKEYIGFVADTLVGEHKVDLDVVFYPFAIRDSQGNIIESPHRQYEVDRVELYIDYNPVLYGDISEYTPTEVYEKDGYIIKYGERGRYIKPHIILQNCFIRPGALYNEMLTTHTYAALSQLKILKNVNISYRLVNNKLRCIITAVPDKRQGISTEFEGTNSGGFFGLGAGAGYTHRNAFRGAEVFNVGLKGAYEMVTPSFSNFDDNYFEIGGETSLTFPRFMLPFLDREFRKTVYATTKFNAGYTFQRRPGFFTRTVLSTGIQYAWNDRLQTGKKHIVDLIDINYVHLPKDKLDPKFFLGLSPGARRYSFSDQFIVSSGYTFTKTNLGQGEKRLLKPVYSLRASVESAGNALAAIAKLAGEKRNEHGSRELFGTQFAQYIKGTFDYSKTHFIDERNSFAWHVGGGLAYPYGNYKEVPIQKRFFSGGGNSLRGWAVRKIGPGSFRPAFDYQDNFYYHSGDIKLDLNVELRSKLFWIIELGAFVDVGNIWTTKNYEGQENGKFELDKFYEQFAASWGLGLRLDFNFVLLRLDCGWKAFDPTGNSKNPEDRKTERWPIKYPHKLSKNAAFHIAVGYPF